MARLPSPQQAAAAPEEPSFETRMRKMEEAILTIAKKISEPARARGAVDVDAEDDDDERSSTNTMTTTTRHLQQGFSSTRVLLTPEIWGEVPDGDPRDLRAALAERYQEGGDNTYTAHMCKVFKRLAFLWATDPVSTEIGRTLIDELERIKAVGRGVDPADVDEAARNFDDDIPLRYKKLNGLASKKPTRGFFSKADYAKRKKKAEEAKDKKADE